MRRTVHRRRVPGLFGVAGGDRAWVGDVFVNLGTEHDTVLVVVMYLGEHLPVRELFPELCQSCFDCLVVVQVESHDYFSFTTRNVRNLVSFLYFS